MRTIRVAIGIVLRDGDNAVLIAKRHSDVHLGGYWEFPGGKCNEMELPADAVRREIHEEVGIDVVVVQQWPTVIHTYVDRAVELYPFVCKWIAGDASAIGSVEVRWTPMSDLPTFHFPDANGPLIARLITEHGAGTPSLKEERGEGSSLPAMG